MKIKQISIFLENKPGHLSDACNIIAEAGINLVTLSLADTEQFGILRIIVKEWERAKEVLNNAGFTVHINDMIATEVEDSPGGLQKILGVLDGAGINIEYMYAFTFKREEKAVLMFRFDDPDSATTALKNGAVNVISSVELFG